MIDPDQFRELLLEPTLKKMVRWGFAGADEPAAINLMLGTCWAESQGGTYLHQVGGPAMGIYQVEIPTHTDVWRNYLRYSSRAAHVVNILPLDARPDEAYGMNADWHNQLITNLEYAVVIARLLYYRQSFEWPDQDDLEALGAIWKEFYNTHKGAGSVEHFVHSYPE